jgi:hypothetical protein
MYLKHGKTEVIDKSRNLHFAIARKKLVKIDPKRLAEVMEKLAYKYNANDNNPLLPYFWEPHNYFCVQGMQNLWSLSR